MTLKERLDKFKIPILWRIERWVLKKKKEKEQEEKDRARGRSDGLGYGMVELPTKKRTFDLCEQCGNKKFFRRTNNIKCTKCGWKKPISND